MNQPNDSTQQQWQALSGNIFRIHQASARRDAVRDDEGKKQENMLETAKKVDELVRSPTIMQHWRQKITSTFERQEVRNVKNSVEVDNVLWKWLDNLNLDTHIDVLYTLLAFCHDDWLRINRIVTNEHKEQSPLLCEYPNRCIYRRRGIPQVLDVFLSYVKRDIEVKTDLDLKPAETGQKTTHAKYWGIGDWFWKLYEKTLKVIVDAVLEKMWPK